MKNLIEHIIIQSLVDLEILFQRLLTIYTEDRSNELDCTTLSSVFQSCISFLVRPELKYGHCETTGYFRLRIEVVVVRKDRHNLKSTAPDI